MTNLITAPEQITTEWLTELLFEEGLLLGDGSQVLQIETKLDQTPLSALAFLNVTYSSDAPETLPRRLFLKYTHPGSLLETFEMGRSEVAFYAQARKLMLDGPVVRCFNAEYDGTNAHFQLLLEDVSANYVSHPASQLAPTFRQSEQIIEALARLHAFWWNHPKLGMSIGTFAPEIEVSKDLEYATSVYERWAEFMGDRLSAQRRELVEQNTDKLLGLLTKRLINKRHLTIAHRDIHIGNLLFPRNTEESSALIIDWDTWGIDLGVADLAYFIPMFWFPERRARYEKLLLKKYHDRLLELGVREYSCEDCLYDYRLAICKVIYRPMHQWAMGLPADIWLNHFERILLAYSDWDCAKFE